MTITYSCECRLCGRELTAGSERGQYVRIWAHFIFRHPRATAREVWAEYQAGRWP